MLEVEKAIHVMREAEEVLDKLRAKNAKLEKRIKLAVEELQELCECDVDYGCPTCQIKFALKDDI